MNEDPYDSLGRAMENAFQRQRDRIQQLKEEPCFDIAKPGDHILVDATAVGKGRPENPLEAEVLRVSGTSYEVRYLTYKAFRSDDPVVEWIQSYVVLSVIGGDE